MGEDLIPHEDLEKGAKLWLEMLDSPGKAVMWEYPVRHADGSWRVLSSTLRNLLHMPEIGAVLSISRDVTEERAAQHEIAKSRKQLAAAQRLANFGSWEIDVRTNQMAWSDQLKRIFGFGPDQDFTYEDYRACIDEETKERLDVLRQRCIDHAEDYSIVMDITRTDGEVRTVEAMGNALVIDGEVQKIFGSCQDITERKELERERAHYIAALEMSNRELQDFAYVASHDLQEPLRKIRVFGDKLSRGWEEELGDEGSRCIQRIDAAAERMSALIEDLLTYSRVNTASRPHVCVDLRHVYEEVIDDLEVIVGETQTHIACDPLPTIEGDFLHLRQLFQNLIGNAMKFRKEDVPPRISISSKILEEDLPKGLARRVELTFDDNGIGFDQKYADNIFTPFQRLHDRNAFEGTGIGLAICRKVVERHGGQILAFSAPNEGATFVVTLPFESEDVRAPHD